VLLKAEQPSRALRDAERAADLDPQIPEFLETRARVYEALGRVQDAIADYRRVLAADPSAQAAVDGLRLLGASASDRAAFPR
jgi:regulator of sirC expression with transglutaminase-like and TPR domain